MYVTVSTTGTVTFRYVYRLNGRRETLTIGRYGPAGISRALAREKLIDAKKAVAQGKSPELEKQTSTAAASCSIAADTPCSMMARGSVQSGAVEASDRAKTWTALAGTIRSGGVIWDPGKQRGQSV